MSQENDPGSLSVGAAALPQPASSESASYHFLQFVMRLPNTTAADLLDPDGDVNDTPSAHYGALAHELTHYIQGLSTVMGQSIILQWIRLASHVEDHLQEQNPVLVPAWKNPKKPGDTSSHDLTQDWSGYMNQVNHLIGAGLPLLPSASAKLTTRTPWEFFEYTYTHPYDQLPTKGVALAVPEADRLVGVPLLGDAFIEGQAQAVQWLVDGSGKSLDERLALRPIDPRGTKKIDLYYTAIIRLVAATMPGWDPYFTTIVLCDFALCCPKPGIALYRAHTLLAKRPPPTSPAGYLAERRNLAALEPEQAGRAKVEAEFVVFADALATAPDDSVGSLMRRLVQLMMAAHEARRTDPAFFLHDLAYRGDWWKRMVGTVGSPPIYLKGDDTPISLANDETVTKACFWARGSFDLLEELVVKGCAGECPLLRTKFCNWHKTHACRTGDLLKAPVVNGQGCYIAIAAKGMGLLGREVTRLP